MPLGRRPARGSHQTGRPPAASAAACGHQQAAHAGEVLGALARRVDVEHHHDVGQRQRAPELARQQPRARVEVRLEAGDQAPARPRACGRPRAWRAPRSGGGRSRRRPARRVAVRPCSSKRRPAPLKPASAGGRLGQLARPPRGRRPAPPARSARCGGRARAARTLAPSTLKRDPPGSSSTLRAAQIALADAHRTRLAGQLDVRAQRRAASAGAANSANASSSSARLA